MAGHLVHALAQNSTDVSSGMIYMLLNICCSVSISLILKFHESRRGSRMVALAGNYIVAAAINLLLWWGMGFAVLNSTAILLGIGVGVLFVLTFWLIMISIGRTGVAITVSVSRLAVVMPVAAAVIFFGERLSVFYIPGLILGLVSFVLFGQAANREETAAKHSWNRWLLLFVFLSMGITGISIQSYEQYFPAEQRSGFLTLVFGVAMICAWFMVLQRREKIRASDMKLGLIMGIPNGLSAFLFI